VPFLHDIRYREAGRGTPPVLLVHGAGGTSALWLPTIHRLARVRRAVAFDLPGHGRSAGTVASVDDWVQAVGQTAAGLCLGRSVLVGHSLGGVAVLAAALTYPDKVAGLVLVATAARLNVSTRILDVIADDWAHWHETMQELGCSPDTPPPTRRRSIALAFGASQAQTLADFRAAAPTLDLRERLGEVTCPTLVVSGDHDLLIPAKRTEALAAGIPGARHVALRAGHFPMLEQPDAFSEALTAFLV
jgi:pimeloyl-ACP methyl ester carboxylesterase